METGDPLESLIALLLDGDWHGYRELEAKTGLTSQQLLAVVRFLAEFSMAELDEASMRCRLESDTRRLWGELA